MLTNTPFYQEAGYYFLHILPFIEYIIVLIYPDRGIGYAILTTRNTIFLPLWNEWKKTEEGSGYAVYALLPKKDEMYRRRGIKVEPKWLSYPYNTLNFLECSAIMMQQNT